MKTLIVVRLQVEGFHNWPDAKEKLPEVDFLSDRHRHMFHIEARREVDHDDRDVEIILFKRKLEEYLCTKYGRPCEFGPMSCEMICKELLLAFDLHSVRVLEDGENGAYIVGA